MNDQVVDAAFRRCAEAMADRQNDLREDSVVNAGPKNIVAPQTDPCLNSREYCGNNAACNKTRFEAPRELTFRTILS